MNKKLYVVFIFGLLFALLACNLPSLLTSGEEPATEEEGTLGEEQPPEDVTQPGGAIDEQDQDQPAEAEEPGENEPSQLQQPPPSGGVIMPDDLDYVGAFRLPDDAGGMGWDYSGIALAYYPDGDPGGPQDGYPGSLFASGHDTTFEVAEITIPEPVNSRNLEDLNIAAVLQPLQDISAGTIDPAAMELPRFGLEYLPPQAGQDSGKLYFSVGQHFQEFEPSHGWRSLNLSEPDVAGLWVFDGCANYTSNDYIFEIPRAWADTYTPGQYLASGRAREGPWSGNGPALFAYGPWNDGNPPAEGATLTSITPLLLYGIQDPGMPEITTDDSMAVNGRMNCDHWLGGAWLTAGDNAAMIFAGTKGTGSCWYGFANGVEWDYECVDTNTCPEVPEWPYDDRGFWAEGYIAQIIFYDPSDLAAVVAGEMETWEPQPYATLDVSEHMYNPNIIPADYKRDILGAAAFDRANGVLYILERLADGYKPVVHVWRVAASGVSSTTPAGEGAVGNTSITGDFDKWSLWSQGTQLRGANVHQWRVYPELVGTEVIGPGPVGPPFTQGDFNQMAAMGANYVNLSVPGIFTINPPYQLDQDVLDNLDNMITMIAEAHMFTVISYRTGPGRSEFTYMWDEAGDWFDESYLNDSMWADQSAQDAWVEMWRQTAEHYRDNPVVVGYDLMVEPNANEVGSHAYTDRLDIWDPDEFFNDYGGTLYDWNQLYPRITEAIRQVESETPIIVGAQSYSAINWLPYLELTGDPRTVYAIHLYIPNYSYQSPDDSVSYPGTFDANWDDVADDVNRAWLDDWLSTVDDYMRAHDVPVVVNEFGGTRWNPGLAQYMDDQMRVFEEHGLNYAFWEWPSSWRPFVSNNNGFNFLFGPDPGNNTVLETSDLIEVIRDNWSRNTVRP